MIRSLLIGLVAGARSMTPLAAVGLAAAANRLPAQSGPFRLLAAPAVGAGGFALAVGEVIGDKMKTAPDRIVPAGLAARLVTGGLAGAAVAGDRGRAAGATLGAAGAVLGAYVTFALRMRALRRWGQTPSGLVEDLLAGSAAFALMTAADRRA